MCSVKTKMISRKLIERLERLHPKIIDLSLDRLNNLLNALDNPQNDYHQLFMWQEQMEKDLQ